MAGISLDHIKYVPFNAAKNYCDVATIKRLNARKNYGSPKDLQDTRDCLATEKGWDSTYNIIAEKISESEIEESLKERAEIHETLKAALDAKDSEGKELPKIQCVDPETMESFSVSHRDYVDAKIACFEWHFYDKKGNLKKPCVLATDSNRRLFVVPDAMAVLLLLARRKQNNPKLQPSEVEDLIPTHVTVKVPDFPGNRFPDVAIRKSAQIASNERKFAGNKEMEPAELLESIRDLVENAGKSQSDVRKMLNPKNPGKGIALYFASVVDIYCRQKANDSSLPKSERDKWSSINFAARLMSPKYLTEADEKAERINPDWLNFKKFNQIAFQGSDTLPQMGNMCETQWKFDAVNVERAAKKKSPIVRPTADMVIDWISATSKEGAARTKIMEIEQIKNLSERAPNDISKATMLAVKNNNEELLRKCNVVAETTNWIFAADEEVYRKVAVLVSCFKDIESKEELHQLLDSLVEEAQTTVAALKPQLATV